MQETLVRPEKVQPKSEAAAIYYCPDTSGNLHFGNSAEEAAAKAAQANSEMRRL